MAVAFAAAFFCLLFFAMLIQNFDLLCLPVTPGSDVVYFPKEVNYNDFVIKNLIVTDFANFSETPLAKDVTTTAEENDNIYITLFDADKNVICQNIPVSLFYSTNAPISIDKKVDFSISRIEVRNSTLANKYLAVGIIYETVVANDTILSNELLNSCSLTVPGNVSEINLTKLGGYILKDKIIKKITVSQNIDGNIYIRQNNGKTINYMPLTVLEQNRTKEGYSFDNITIDTDNSYLYVSQHTTTTTGNGSTFSITFYYKNK